MGSSSDPGVVCDVAGRDLDPDTKGSPERERFDSPCGGGVSLGHRVSDEPVLVGRALDRLGLGDRPGAGVDEDRRQSRPSGVGGTTADLDSDFGPGLDHVQPESRAGTRLSVTREELEARLRGRQGTDGEFEPVSFQAFVKVARIIPGGETEITLVVPREQKYLAIPLTDADGFMVQITAEKVQR